MPGGARLCAAALLSTLAAAPAWAQLPPEAQLDVAEEHTTTTIDPNNPHLVYVLDPVFPHLIAGKVYVVDGQKADVVGMINAGYVPNMTLPRDKDSFYVAETYWSRGTRGDRVDVVTAYDKATLDAESEVILPQGRFLVVTKKWSAAQTPDGRYLLSFNMAPATTVSIVDTEEMRYVGEVETPGCALVFPSAPTRFSMLCADGSMLTASFDANGQSQTSRSEPFFDPETDPVFGHPAFDREGAMAYFISYEGMVHPVDLSGEQPNFGEAWSLVAEADKAENWRPGGWQPFAVHPASNRLFVMMHQGERWTHKQPGTEVWVFDVETKERLQRIPLEEHAMSLIVSLDEAPRLFTLSEAATLDIWDAQTYEHQATVEQLGDSPLVLYVAGE